MIDQRTEARIYQLADEGLQVAAIAVRLGLSYGAVYQRLLRRGQLRHRFGRSETDEGAYLPTLAEIWDEGCRRIREEGFIDESGRYRPPWTAATYRKRRRDGPTAVRAMVVVISKWHNGQPIF